MITSGKNGKARPGASTILLAAMPSRQDQMENNPPLNAAHSTRSGLILQACIMHSKGDAKRRREQKKSGMIFLSKRDGLQSVL
jgi:hypothetical protein